MVTAAPSVTRASAGKLTAGAAFDQRISLGFPVGTTTEHAPLVVFAFQDAVDGLILRADGQ